MLENLVIGWDKIEPVFLVNVALNKPLILLGKHGTCKTTCAKAIAQIYGKKSFRFYDATKDDLISIAGIPIPQKLAQGKLEFSRHDRSIWGAKVIVVDELTRANRENQNLWLEILEEKTCFGKKLCYEVLIATMNPESYAATFKLDEALLDRFYAVVPVPDLQKGTTSETFREVIKMNLGEHTLNKDDVKKAITRIRSTYDTLLDNKNIVAAVSEYVANYTEILLTKTDSYISPRKTIHLVEEILGLGAHFVASNKRDFLVEAAQTAVIYVLGIPFKIKPEVLMQIHANLRQILLKKTISRAEKTRIELSKIAENGVMIHYVKKNVRKIEKHLPYDETEKLVAQIVEHCKYKDLPVLRDLLAKIEGHEEQKRTIEARIIFHEMIMANKIQERFTRYRIRNDKDFEMFEKMKLFMQRLKKLPLQRKIEKLVFKEEIDFREIIRFVWKGGFDEHESKANPSLQRAGPESARNIAIRADQ